MVFFFGVGGEFDVFFFSNVTFPRCWQVPPEISVLCKSCHHDPVIIASYPEKGKKARRCPDELHSQCLLKRDDSKECLCVQTPTESREVPHGIC